MWMRCVCVGLSMRARIRAHDTRTYVTLDLISCSRLAVYKAERNNDSV